MTSNTTALPTITVADMRGAYMLAAAEDTTGITRAGEVTIIEDDIHVHVGLASYETRPRSSSGLLSAYNASPDQPGPWRAIAVVGGIDLEAGQLFVVEYDHAAIRAARAAEIELRLEALRFRAAEVNRRIRRLSDDGELDHPLVHEMVDLDDQIRGLERDLAGLA